MDYDDFVREFDQLSGIQLGFYKEKQMRRRINTLIERERIDGYQEYFNILKSDEAELASFIDYITINVTEFFRTPEQWSTFEELALKKLVNKDDAKLKIWCCACSTGEEAYSLAISLLNLTDASRFHIIATDIDERVLQKAERGCFDERSMSSVSEEIRKLYFQKEENRWIVDSSLKNCITFERLDLLKDEYPKDCDLIVCRNVLIYFTEVAKDHIYTDFKRSLKTGGYLFTGKTEQIVYYKRRGFNKIKTFLYENAD